uniref:SKA complex subunit 1 n=1 Tax=Corethrella appendiculata TaxID=1370023 RepID=U5EXS1_9DIPT
METISEKISKQLQKVQLLEDFFKIQAQKKDLAPNLLKLNSESQFVVDILQSVASNIDEFESNQVQKYQNILRQARINELRMLNLLEKLEEEPTGKVVAKEPLRDVKYETNRLAQNSSVKKIQNYSKEKSPIVLSGRALFESFECTEVSCELFQAIPKYMRGRETVEDLNLFLKTIVQCFTDKYSVMKKRRDHIRNPGEMELWRMFREQEPLFKNQKFITQGDIARTLDRMIDRKLNARLQMLRHLQIIQETRKNNTIFYIWINQSQRLN